MRNKNIEVAIQSFLLVTVTFLNPKDCNAQKDSLKAFISTISRNVDGQVGIAAMELESGDSLFFNTHGIFPMQSIYKFPLALTVLHQVDKGKFSLDQKIHLRKQDMLKGTWSLLAKKYPDGNVDITLKELLEYTVIQSDNNGCDILFRLMKGTKKVHDYIQSLGVKEMAIAATEEEMHKEWDAQFTNWCKPRAMLKLLQLFYEGKILSQSSHDFLMDCMARTTTGPRRIKGLLPQGTIVAHRTGTGGTKDERISAVNDVGIITMPSGKSVALVIYVSRAKGKLEVLEDSIASISLAVFKYYNKY